MLALSCTITYYTFFFVSNIIICQHILINVSEDFSTWILQIDLYHNTGIYNETLKDTESLFPAIFEINKIN